MTYDAIDCQGFAGGFTTGVVQAGFRLVGKRELPGGFGVESCEANRHILGNDWVTEVGPEEEWTPYHVPFVFGNPPCSGFSLLSAKDFRGIDSPVNSCMWSLVDFAGRCHPEFVVFESVQPAFKQGRPLMQNLRERLEKRTGRQYTLWHVLHNASRIGGCAIRKRYFFVCAAMPFGVHETNEKPFPAINAIGDLQGLANTMELQPYKHPPYSRWARGKRAAAVDGHLTKTNPQAQRAYDLMQGVVWEPSESISVVARKYYQRYGRLPESWGDIRTDKLVSSDFRMGYNQLFRWPAEKPARVVTGGAHILVLHPYENRLLTIREIARIQGFPDDWRIAPLLRTMSMGRIGPLWGKGIPVESGRWIAQAVHDALDGAPAPVIGEEIGERERLVNLT